MIQPLAAGLLAGTLLGAAATGGLLAWTETPHRAPEIDPVSSAGTQPAGAAPALAGTATAVGEPVAADAAATTGSGAEPEIQLPTTGADAAALRALKVQVADLQARLTRVEADLRRAAAGGAASRGARESERPQPPRTAEERRDVLVAAGVDRALAEDWTLREAQRSLDQLALRDQAIREGWLGTARYREELTRINADARSLRDEIGDENYDRYLYATGEDNRVAVGAVIPGSAAESAGLQPGDLIESYADSRLFSFSELRNLTTEGEYGETVAVRVRRNGRVVEAWVPRGPLGVTLGSERVEPGP